MTYDLVLRGGEVVDGLGGPRARADVAVAAGAIAAVDPPSASARWSADRVIDVDGLVVCPGFIDLHTHYDAQVLWDPACTPSPFHGTTTVVGGNCGFTLAPAAPVEQAYLLAMLARVEGMDPDSLSIGVTRPWPTFDEYLRALDGTLAVNAGFLAGHSTIRRSVMGPRAVGEAATADDVEAMRALLGASLAAGALGFSSSWSATHNDADGEPVPSRHASADELVALCDVVGRHEGTTVEFIPNVAGRDPFSDDLVQLMGRMSVAADRPLNWNILLAGRSTEALVRHQLGASDVVASMGGEAVALALPDLMQPRFSLRTGFGFDTFPGWSKVMALPVPEKLKALSDPGLRADLREAALGEARPWVWEQLVFEATSTGHQGWSAGEVAAARGVTAFDAVVDVAVEDGMDTVLRPPAIDDDDESWALRAEVWADDRVVLGATDSGAHLDALSTFNAPTALLGPHVRDRGVMELEEAVHRLTDVQARLYGLRDRGRLAVGARADVVVLDPATVGPGSVELRHDLPGGAARLYGTASGIEHVFVNGTEIVRGGDLTGARPGAVLRSGRDTTSVRPQTRHRARPGGRPR
ncbi:MAG TPA: amidohydrolase family protein [Acidimicrobiales bacterium]|nr:amidohydrolase family protein [Acidimicrobiales bacterium]